MAATLKNIDDLGKLSKNVLRGDSQASRLFYGPLYDYVYRIVARKLKSETDREDLCQIVLLEVHRSLPTYTPGRPLKSWINAILAFKLADFFRAYYKKTPYETSLDQVEVLEKSSGPFLQDDLIDLKSAILALPEKERDLLLKVKILGHSYDEIEKGERGKLKVAVSRTMKKLRKELA